MALVVSSVMCVLASAAVLRREEDPPGGLRSHGRSGRFTPFAPIAHSGPSHRFLRPLLRAGLVSGGPLPLPSSGGGQATRAGLPPSAVPLPLPYVMNTECFQPVYRRRWRHKTSQVGKMLSTCNARTHRCPICVAGRGTKRRRSAKFFPPATPEHTGARFASQVEAQNVAGRQNAFNLQRQNAPVPDLRRRWNKKCPPATRRWHTCDTAS